MKGLLLLVCFSPLLIYGQSYRKFNEAILQIKSKKDSLLPLDANLVFSKNEQTVLYDWENVVHLTLTHLQKELRKKDSLQLSVFLTDLAAVCTETWKMSNYADAEKWGKINKHLNRAKRKFQLNFGILRSAAFRIPLLKDNKGNFYLDKKDATSPYALYKGKKKDKKQDEDAEPLEFFTEQELAVMIEKKLLRGNLRSQFKAGNYSFVGVSIQIDENSFRKKKIPSARVVILFGAKRLKLVK